MYTLVKLFLVGRTRMKIRLIVSVPTTGHVRTPRQSSVARTNERNGRGGGWGPERVLNFIMHEEKL